MMKKLTICVVLLATLAGCHKKTTEVPAGRCEVVGFSTSGDEMIHWVDSGVMITIPVEKLSEYWAERRCEK